MLPVLLINIAIFSVICGAIQTKQFQGIQKKFSQKETPETDSDSERLIRLEDSTNYGSNTMTVNDTLDPGSPTGGHSANIDQASMQSDSESEVVRVEMEHTPDHDTTTRPADPVDVVIQTEYPLSNGDTTMNTGPTLKLCSDVRNGPSATTTNIESISGSRDDVRAIEHDTAADIIPIINAEFEDVKF